jgi:hypothetical protein
VWLREETEECKTKECGLRAKTPLSELIQYASDSSIKTTSFREPRYCREKRPGAGFASLHHDVNALIFIPGKRVSVGRSKLCHKI